jgi:hypothetical protein
MNKQDRFVPSGWRGQFKNFPTILANEESQNDLLPDQVHFSCFKLDKKKEHLNIVTIYKSSYLASGPVFTKKRSGSGSSDPDFIFIVLYY